MTNLQVINYIASHPEYTTIVINDNDDKLPMEAVEYLSGLNIETKWSIDGSLEKDTLLVYQKHII